MRKPRSVVFERAVLALLSAAAGCGGSIVVVDDGGGRGSTNALDGSAWTPPNAAPSCGWSGGALGNCAWSIFFSGDPVQCAGFSGATATLAQCQAVCGNPFDHAVTSCAVLLSGGDPAGTYELTCLSNDPNDPVCGPMPIVPIGNGGRRPAYFASLGFGVAPRGREVGTHFARVACLEAGSVEAFRVLRDDLRAHGAPARLVRSAARAMRDEMRHVRQTSALARRFGERPVAPRQGSPSVKRPLEAVALENAVEGCVRETYSALECLWQAHRAEDRVVRATMARIARDEMRHLTLSWEVHAWAMTKLTPSGRRRVQEAQRREVAALAAEMREEHRPGLCTTAGLPGSAESMALIDTIASQLAA